MPALFALLETCTFSDAIHAAAGALHIAEDLDVFEVSKDQISIRKSLVQATSWGYWHSDGEGVHAAPGSGAASMPFTRHSILAGFGLS